MRGRVCLLALIVVLLSACGGSAPPIQATPTPEPGGSCIGASDADPNTPTVGSRSTYDGLKAKIAHIRQEASKIILNDDAGHKHRNEIQASIDEVIASWKALERSSLDGWEGWVVSVGTQDVALIDPLWVHEMPGDWRTMSDVVVVAIDDPFSIAPVPEPTATPESMDMSWMGNTVPSPFAVIVHPSMPGGGSLCLGDKVQFGGLVSKTSIEPGANTTSLGLVILDGNTTLVGKNIQTNGIAPDLRGTVVKFGRLGCYGACQSYDVTLLADGTEIFFGRGYTRFSGFKLGQIGEDGVRKVMKELQGRGFFSMRSYTSEDVTDNPGAYIEVMQPGIDHKVSHYHGDTSAPRELYLLEERLDELLNTEQWRD